jgi:hypothetical protein
VMSCVCPHNCSGVIYVKKVCVGWYQRFCWGYFVVVIKVIIGGSSYVNVESLFGVQMKTFLLELQCLHEMGISK